MFGLSSCTTSLVLLAVLALVACFLLAIVGLGSRRLVRESGRHHWLVATPVLLYKPNHFGKELDVPRSRLAGLFHLAVILIAVVVLAAAARSGAC